MKLQLLLGIMLLGRGAEAAPADAPVPAGATLEFIENRGQWDARARYVAPLPGGRLFAEADGLTFALLVNGGPAQHRHGSKPASPAPAADSVIRGHALTLHFEGALPAALTAETPTAERRSYFLGNDPRHWAADVRGYRALRYAGLWPGVDAQVYESADQHLEYDFVLAPGAQPAAIGLRHDGADALALDAEGNLVVKTSVGTVTEQAPRAWQTDAAGRRRPVACRYVLTGTIVRFALGKYDATRPLTIDPVVVFATYSGSTADNWGFTAAYDTQGNLYSGGIVFGVGYPATPGAFQTTFAGLIDIAIIKYNTNVSGPAARVWATYLGGSSADFPTSLVVNNQGELLVLGTSGSANFPTTAGALQRTFGGGVSTSPFGFNYAPYNAPKGSDLVIIRLAANGAALVGSTYLGGSGNDGLLPLTPTIAPDSTEAQLAHNYGDPFRGDIVVDAADNVYIASHTASANFPLAGGFDTTYNGGTSDGVVCKLTPGLTALTWGSFLGGAGADAAYSIQLEPGSGDVYVAGGTLSPDFPVTPGAYRTVRPGRVDGFAARIAAGGTGLLRATYVGTADYDQAYFLQVGTDGGVYLLGQTTGAFPVTPGLYGTANGTQFIQKLDANLSASLLATVFGSGATRPGGRRAINLSPTAFLVDRCDRVYVCGWGGQVNQGQAYQADNGTVTGMPTTPNAAQTATDGSDFYLAQFGAGLTGLDYGTYYGDTAPGTEGEHVDGGTSRFDPRGIVYQAVCSCFSATGFPIPPGANTYSPTNNSGAVTSNTACNNAAFVLNFQPSIANAGTDRTVCATAGPQPLVGTPAGGIWTGPGVSGSVATGFFFTPLAALVGVQTVTYTVLSTGLCTTTDTRRVTVTALPTVAFTPLLQAAYCAPAAGAPPLPLVPLTATPAGGTFSGPGVSGSVAAGFFFSPNLAPGTVQLVYGLSAGGCAVQGTQAVIIHPLASAGPDQTLCATSGPQPLSGAPAGGVWTGPGISGSVSTGFVFTPSAALVGVQTLTYTVNNASACAATRAVTVVVPAVVTITPLLQMAYCVPPPSAPPLPVVALAATPAGGVFSGPGVSGSRATGFVFSPNLPPGTVQVVYTVNDSSCTVQATRAVTISTLAAAGADQTLCATASPLPLTGSPGGGVFSGPGVSGTVATGFVFTPSLALLGVQTLTYAVTSACIGTRRVTVTAPPAVAITAGPAPAYCLAGSGGPAAIVVPLAATPAGGTFSGPGVSGSVATGFVFTATLALPGTVQVLYAVSVDGCVLQATRTVNLRSLPAPVLAPDTVLCAGSTRPFALRGSPAGGVFSGPGVSGNVGAGFVFTPSAAFSAPVTLTYTLTSNGCTGTATRQVAMATAPALQLAWTPVACAETRLAPLTVRFTAGTSLPSADLLWDFGDGTQATGASPTHTYAAPGTYRPRLTLRYNAGRCETQTPLPPVEVKERKMPNIITPNGDADNQTFQLGPDCAPRLQMFSRWGRQVFEAAAYHDEWSAQGQPDGIYYYLLTYPDGHRVKGWVEVVR